MTLSGLLLAHGSLLAQHGTLLAQHGTWTQALQTGTSYGMTHLRAEVSRVTVFSQFAGSQSLSLPPNRSIRVGRDWLTVQASSNAVTVFTAYDRGHHRVSDNGDLALHGTGTNQVVLRSPTRVVAISGRSGRLAAVPLPHATVLVDSSVALALSTGGQLAAYSPAGGVWSRTTVSATATSAHRAASLAAVTDGQNLHYYSSRIEAWQSLRLPAGNLTAHVPRGSDVMVFQSPNECLAISGINGRSARLRTQIPASIRVTAGPATASVAGALHCFCAGTGQWVAVPRSSTATTKVGN